MTSYLLKLAGIIVVASAAGITHSLINGPLDLELAPIPEGAGTVVIPPKPVEPTDEPPAEATDSDNTNIETLVLEREITLDQARLLFEHRMANFVDARTKEKYESGHILDANSIPPDAFTRGTPPVVDFFEEDRPVVVYCDGGDCHDSHVVIEQIQLIRPELVLVHVFTDGYPAWTNAGLPTDTGPDPLAE